MVSACPFFPKSSTPTINPLVTKRRAPITIGITVTFMFHSFFCSLARFSYLPFFSLSFSFTLWSVWTAKSTIRPVPFLFADYYEVWSSGRDYMISLYHKIPENFVHLFFRTDSGLCIYHLLVWSNLDFLHNSQWITLPFFVLIYCIHSLCDL